MSELQATASLQRVMADAKALAESRGHEYVGTEHILFAIAGSTQDDVAQRVLTQLGASGAAIQSVMEEVMQPAALPWGTSKRRSGVHHEATELPYTSRAGAALLHAVAMTNEMGHPALGTGQMLLGLLHDPRSPAGRVLAKLGMSYEAALRLILELETEST